MGQIFHPSTNTISRISIYGAVFMAAGLLWTLSAVMRSSYVTQAGVARDQPVPFSHAHHVAILIVLTMGDYATRGWLPFPGK